MISEILLSLFYIALFIVIIYKWHFFDFQGIQKNELSIIFVIKVLMGIMLTLIYSYYYKVRSEADIFKFFDDSAYLYNALFVNPIHYFQLVFGINSDADYLKVYTEGTSFWAIHTDEYWKFTGTENHNYFNSHRLVTQFNALVRLFSFGKFTVHTIFMCFIAFIGQVALYKALYKFVADKKYFLITGVFLIPSVLLWSSGVLKEGFVFLGLGFFFYAFLKISEKGYSNKRIFLVFFSLVILLFVKYYIVAAVVPAAIAYILAKRLPSTYFYIPYVVVYGLIFFLLLMVPVISPPLPNPLKILSEKQNEILRESNGGHYILRNYYGVEEFIYFPHDVTFEKIVTDSSRNIFKIRPGVTAFRYDSGVITGEKVFIDDSLNANIYYWEIYAQPRAGSLISIRTLNPDFLSFLKAAPMGLVNVLFRPHPFEAKSVLMMPAALENILLILFIFICLFFCKEKLENGNLFLFLMCTALTLYFVIGITTNVLGAVVRYKAPLMPLIITALLLILDIKKLRIFISKFQRKKK
ncbi:MAG: hypothetical protein PHT69_07630 [Bacteroidales bacterium]|nr:hypothetical protein [Bacteroidales bacterium]